jgi:phosphoribosyl 1,2-cyclic phosphodiesterase
MRIEFHGVRGSTPCAGPQYARYGGHSSCVSLTADGHPPVILDLGTGLTPYGEQLGGASPFHGAVLLTHMHWDHVQGLPFFRPLHQPESTLDIYGPRQDDGPLGEVFAGLMRPPYFPIRPDQLGATLDFHDIGDDDFPVGHAKVRSRWVRHVGPTLGFRVELNGGSVAYISDHGPGCRGDSDDFVPHEILELCDGVDVLIHDAQHTQEEYGPKRSWGHCTYDYAVHVARESGAHKLALYHHDPSHGDDAIDDLTERARDTADRVGGPEVFAAAEGLTLEVGARAASAGANGVAVNGSALNGRAVNGSAVNGAKTNGATANGTGRSAINETYATETRR